LLAEGQDLEEAWQRQVGSRLTASAQPPHQRVSLRPEPILGLNPGLMTGPGTNTYLVGKRDPILIDTGAGVADYVALLDGYLAQRRWRHPARIILTHRHRDHLGGVEQLRQRFPGIPVAKMIHRDAALPEGLSDLRDGQELEGEGATLVAVHTPGHASDHLCYYLREEWTWSESIPPTDL
jgi:glyoxylase-like metal-dependent hydrolase (beta-lactamase superfamily II)